MESMKTTLYNMSCNTVFPTMLSYVNLIQNNKNKLKSTIAMVTDF